MKRQENHISSSQGVKNTIDQKSKKAVSWFSTLPVSNVNTEKIWQSIERKLEDMDKKILTWFMAMTTSFTLLVAASLEYADQIEMFQNEPTIELPKEMSLLIEEKKYSHRVNSAPFLYNKVSKIYPEMESTLEIRKTDIIQVNNYKRQSDRSVLTRRKTSTKPKLSIRGEINFSNKGLNPGMGVDIKLLEITGSKANHSIHIGWTSFLNTLPSTEINESETTFMNFVKVGYGYTTGTAKGWQIESGYLLNPDGAFYDNSTIKLTMQRKIGRHLRIGPEVTFTKGFQKIIPSFSVLFSS